MARMLSLILAVLFSTAASAQDPRPSLCDPTGISHSMQALAGMVTGMTDADALKVADEHFKFRLLSEFYPETPAVESSTVTEAHIRLLASGIEDDISSLQSATNHVDVQLHTRAVYRRSYQLGIWIGMYIATYETELETKPELIETAFEDVAAYLGCRIADLKG
jgi:hypothetical protein